MNKDVLKWVLVALVVVGAAGYFILSERSSGKEQPIPGIGHSRAFTIEPIEGITISASENALDKDREFKISPVNNKTFKKVSKIMDTDQEKTLMVFDLDAGLKPDEHFPGDYNVTIDLNELGIPRSLHEQVQVYRMAGQDDEYLRYKTQVNDGMLSFRSNQNSLLIFTLVSSGLILSRWAARTVFEIAGSPSKWVRRYFFGEPTTLSVPFKDPSGDFMITFRFKDTENPDGFKAFKENEEAFFARLDQLEKEADTMYENKVEKEMEKTHKGYSLWRKWFPDEQAQAIMESIDKEAILKELVVKDSVLQRLNTDPAGQLPPSILKIKEYIIRANQYLNSVDVHPFDYEMAVYLVNSEVMGKDVTGSCKKYNFCGNAFMLLKYEVSDLTARAAAWESMQVTLAHEFFHGRQQSYYAYTMMGSCPAESTAAVLERDAAKYWYNSGVIKHRDPSSTTGFDNASDLLTDRTKTEIYGYPFDSINGIFSWTDEPTGYSMASAIEGIREGVGKNNLGMVFFAQSYSLHGPHITTWSKWIKHSLGIDDVQFNNGWRYFGETNLPRIYDGQHRTPGKTTTTIIELKPTKPVYHLKKLSDTKDYAVNTYQIKLPKKIEDKVISREGLSDDEYQKAMIDKKIALAGPEKANVFVYSKSGEYNPYVTFYWSDLRFEDYFKTRGDEKYPLRASPAMYYAGNRDTDLKKNDDGSLKVADSGYNVPNQKEGYQLAVITTQQSAGRECDDYYVVALFAPDTPEIRKVKEDQISFIMPKPDRDLRKDKLITGAVVTYKDKNGVEHTHKVAPKYFGKKVKWTVEGASEPGNAFSLSLHWFYQPDEGTTYDSPESEKATWGVMEDDKPEEVSGYKPETNYWKRVSIRGNMVTSGKVEEKLDGVDFVNPDYRFVELKQQDMGSFEIEGWAAVNTSKDERIYERTLSLDGDLTMTTPPEFWVPGVEYAGVWSIEQDPYVAKIGDPFGFKADITTTSEKACAASRKAKTDTGRSSKGSSPWIRKYTGTFMARHPEGDAPRAFSLTQTFEVAERPGSDRKALVTYIYDYEWVGEPQEEVEEETVPEGGYWTKVKTEVYDQHMSYKSDNGGTYTISGGGGQFNVHIGLNGEVMVRGKDGMNYPTGNYDLMRTIDRVHRFDVPKQYYVPGDKVNGTDGACAIKTVSDKGVPDDRAYHYGRAYMSVSKPDYTFKAPQTVYIPPQYAEKAYQEGGDISVSVPDKLMYPDGFKIVQTIMVNGKCYYEAIYTYKWVEDGKKPESTAAVSGGHWKLTHTAVSTEQGMISGPSEGINIQGGSGHYNAHVEEDGNVSDREIVFEKPKAVYMPGEEFTLKVTNEKPKLKGGKEGLSYGDVAFSNGKYDGDIDYPGFDDNPAYNNKKVVGVAHGKAPSKGTAGVVDFTITEYIKVKGRISKVNTTYMYEWVE